MGVAERLRRRIARDGPLPFSAFMDEALYGEGGYYRSPVTAIGPAGDFVTGSSISPLFAGATRELLQRLDIRLSAIATLLEVGYGTGQHLRHLASMLDPGEQRTVLACDRIGEELAAGVAQRTTLEAVESGSIDGLIFSYELFDALPVHRLLRTRTGYAELSVGVGANGEFEWVTAPLSEPRLPELLGDEELEVGQIADLSTQWRPLYRTMAERLGRGLIVTCDYGFERRQLLDVRVRRHGTLACYRHHRVHRDALSDVGNQDLTAHVDFTALREEGEAAGLKTLILTRQANWLMALGVFDALQGADVRLRQEARLLFDPAGMGHEIRVLIQARGIGFEGLFDAELIG